eukprot:TRINITY_DN1611_c0_g1_i1.p1 TRINITY_DN1611_c0_g1~~TRINITY_DN1611_c0_g1_i1.p1  ORF type:complete len:386 (+),score=73.46 TRINITY_DN1611_c0_g1_i1:76-1233(+)
MENASMTNALKAVSEDKREKLKLLWLDTDGAKREARKAFRRWGQEQSGVGGVVGETFDKVMEMEVFNQRVWRMTATMVLPERGFATQWCPSDVNNFIHDTARGGENKEALLKGITSKNPKLAEPDSAEWMRDLMLPFRSAFLTTAALKLMEKALCIQHSGKPCEKDMLGVEWKYCIQFVPTKDDLYAMMDDFEAFHTDNARSATNLNLSKLCKKNNIVAIYLRDHTAAVISPALAEHSGRCYLPAELAILSKSLPSTDTVLRLKNILSREDALCYSVAAYLLIKHDKQNYLKWVSEFLSLSEDVDGLFAPYCGISPTYPFLQITKEAAVQEASKMMEAHRRRQRYVLYFTQGKELLKTKLAMAYVLLVSVIVGLCLAKYRHTGTV